MKFLYVTIRRIVREFVVLIAGVFFIGEYVVKIFIVRNRLNVARIDRLYMLVGILVVVVAAAAYFLLS